MLDYGIRLDARDTHPLARAFSLTRGDRKASRLKLWFCDGDTALGEDTGDYATLSLRRLGQSETHSYLLTREEGAYTLVLEERIVPSGGLYMATATLYDQDELRLTVGRFSFSVMEDFSLPEDDQLAQEQVTLLQQALGAVALMEDHAEQVADTAAEAGDYARAQGALAKHWAEAAKDVVEGVAVTWETLAGRPSTFPPASHSHALLDAATSAPTGNALARRDAAGRMQASAPAAASDVARKAEIDEISAQVDAKADTAVCFEAALTVAGWTGETAPYTQTVAAAQANGDRVALVSPAPLADAGQMESARKAYACIDRIVVSAGALTAYAGKKPAANLTLRIAQIG